MQQKYLEEKKTHTHTHTNDGCMEGAGKLYGNL